ncbi:MAG: TRAP transporter large permease [Deltaproteobacteria bacterium]|nr:TRAP transporter large permease [Deltaproteobacteria bacterium]
MALIILICLFLGFMMLSCPIALAMGIAVMGYLFMEGNVPLLLIPKHLAVAVNSFTLLAVPLFILAAEIMNHVGVTDRIFRFALSIVGSVRGGLGHVNVLASMIFAGMSGCATADAAGLGTIEIKAMCKAGYDPEFSAAITAASSTIGPIIPPSIIMVVYAVIAEESIGQMFLGGLVPGVLMGLFLMATIYLFSWMGWAKCPIGHHFHFRELFSSFRQAFLSLLAPVIILGSIFFGITTPTESAAVAVLYAVFLGVYYRTLTVRLLIQAFTETSALSAVVLFLIAASKVLGWVITLEKVPELVFTTLYQFTHNKALIVLIIDIAILFLGCFMSATAGVVIVTPILLEVASGVGMNMIHLGVMLVVGLLIGINTPPVGICLYVVSDVANISVDQMFRAILPFLIPLIGILLLVSYIPSLTLFLPNLLMN